MTRRTFSTEFKQEAACLVLDHDYSNQQAGDAVGIGVTALRRWVNQLRDERRGKTPERSRAMTPDQQRIQELEARIRKQDQKDWTGERHLKKAPALLMSGSYNA